MFISRYITTIVVCDWNLAAVTVPAWHEASVVYIECREGLLWAVALSDVVRLCITNESLQTTTGLSSWHETAVTNHKQSCLCGEGSICSCTGQQH